MDRNVLRKELVRLISVAPLAGSVDRNQNAVLCFPPGCLSLPSRGAWIEIPCCDYSIAQIPVAPLAGSVDRNLPGTGEITSAGRSLPSRGAWIEIRMLPLLRKRQLRSLPSRGAWIEIFGQAGHSPESRVAPLAGSVDRNNEPISHNTDLC